jgi:hypothetical protein
LVTLILFLVLAAGFKVVPASAAPLPAAVMERGTRELDFSAHALAASDLLGAGGADLTLYSLEPCAKGVSLLDAAARAEAYSDLEDLLLRVIGASDLVERLRNMDAPR